jgi:activator of HSP90 ATPase
MEITYNGISLRIEGSYTSPEEMIRYYNDLSGYPGSHQSFEIQEIYLLDSMVNIIDLFEEDALQEMEEQILEKYYE